MKNNPEKKPSQQKPSLLVRLQQKNESQKRNIALAGSIVATGLIVSVWSFTTLPGYFENNPSSSDSEASSLFGDIKTDTTDALANVKNAWGSAWGDGEDEASESDTDDGERFEIKAQEEERQEVSPKVNTEGTTGFEQFFNSSVEVSSTDETTTDQAELEVEVDRSAGVNEFGQDSTERDNRVESDPTEESTSLDAYLQALELEEQARSQQ